MAEFSKCNRWYIAELTEEVTLESDPQKLVHRKTQVIFADSPEDAYEKAVSLITEQEISYLTEQQRVIHTRFWGLRELDPADDGAERPLKQPEIEVAVDRRQNGSRITPEQQLALLMSVKPGARPH